ncbi:MAG: glycosyltransferase [Coriobacteriales bacterium]|nr:glycosyltransferase [Coriobacteriales bacterium]
MAKPIITYAIPCYNSQDYMANCIKSILACKKKNIEIIIIDDGSTDSTLAIAHSFQQKYPKIIRAIRQKNAGHGGAVMTGLRNAKGKYFKVVDSDDWLDNKSNISLVNTLEMLNKQKKDVDLVLCNYVYENEKDKTSKAMRLDKTLPQNKIFSWEDAKKFGVTEYILMHSVIYRTKILRKSRVKLPKHTFYVDNIFVYVPLPYCKKLYYLNKDLYRYYIGREDQSVNQDVMISRVDQQLKITKIMIDSFVLNKYVDSVKLRNYMRNYLALMTTISSVFLLLGNKPNKVELKDDIWNYLKTKDYESYKAIKKTIFGLGCNVPGKIGDEFLIKAYKIFQKIFHFN